MERKKENQEGEEDNNNLDSESDQTETMWEELMDLDPHIVGVAIVIGGQIEQLLHTRKLQIPDVNRTGNMIMQGAMMLSITDSNNDLFGKVHHIVVRHEHMDIILINMINPFPENPYPYLVICVKRPYDIEEIIASIKKEQTLTK
jgi:hypothetical protein